MTRLNFPYFMNETAVKYIIEAVKMVARDGWKLLPQVSMYSIALHCTHRLVCYYYYSVLHNINHTHGLLQMPPAMPWLRIQMLGYSCIVLHCIAWGVLKLFACDIVCVHWTWASSGVDALCHHCGRLWISMAYHQSMAVANCNLTSSSFMQSVICIILI